MLDRAKENETPLSPKADSPAPEIFSSKKIFFLNSSCSGSRRSEIPHIESDYCPRDEVSRRLFHHGDDSCDCDCTSDGCGGCLRRNKQCFFKFFVLALSIALVLLLFGSLSYNLTRNKDVDNSLDLEETKWVPHYHEYPSPKEKELLTGNVTNFVEMEPVLEAPVPMVSDSPDDYDSSEDKMRLRYYVDENFARDQIQPISFLPLNDRDENSPHEILIYDGREPLRIRRSASPRSDTKERGLKSKRVAEPRYEYFFDERKDLEEGMEKFWEGYLKKKKAVFRPFSLTTPFHSTPVGSEEYSMEEEIEDELKNRFLTPAPLEDFHSATTPKGKTSKGSVDVNWAAADVTKIVLPQENSSTEKTAPSETVNSSEEKRIVVTSTTYSSDENGRAVVESFEPAPTFFSAGNFKSLNFFEKNEDWSYENNFEMDNSRIVETSLNTAVAITETTVGKSTAPPGTLNSFKENAKLFSADEREFRTFWPLFHFSIPAPGLFGSSQKDQLSVEPTPLDTVKGISLADAKKIRKERRKHLLLNSRVVGGSSDVRLPTGPDASKPLVNAFETLKTNQQLSFTPSAASQFVLPYQMCLFAGPFPVTRPSAYAAQPRTFSFGAHPLIPSILDKNSPVNTPYHVPAQQNFLTFSINNYPNAPPSHQPTQVSGSSSFSFPSQKQFPQPPMPNRQPIFCTYLQPPLFQFPTVPGTADFSHAKCVDCSGDSQKEGLFAKEFAFPSGRDILCSDERVSCKDGSSCIPLKNWCDNQVNCKDASDEAFCSCRERLAKVRLCDGYIDCPHGEDETGCFDCPKSAFSCESVISPESCIPLSKRCDGVRDCATGADEIDCSALFFNVGHNNSYQVPQTSGYLHRNLKGDWFPVCVEVDGNFWAKEACLGELGVLPPNVDVRFAPISGHYKGPFVVRKEEGTPALQDHCKGHVSTFVKCPAMSCGTRVELYSSQKLDSHYFEDDLDTTNFAPSVLLRGSHIALKEENSRLKREETGRVVGGRESEPRAWPWAIAVYKDGAFHCGGVILDENWVLTAAHCMEQYWKHYYEVRGGMLRRFSFSAMEQARTVSHVIIHENYDLTIMSSDLALLRLQKPFDFNRWVRHACLPALQDGVSKFTSGPAPGTRCIAVGWGAIKERGTDPDQLREVEIPIMTKCKHKEDLVGAEICAGKDEGGKDTCQGDSGGPLLCKDSGSPASWYVAGIVSHGEGCARPGEPGAYTRISLFVDWITANTNDFQLPSVKPLQNCPGFRCHSASKICISRKWVCNGFSDCLEAEDEKNCSFDSAAANTFGRQYSNEHKHVESKDSGGLNHLKITSEAYNLKSTTKVLDKLKNVNDGISKFEKTGDKDLSDEKKSKKTTYLEFFSGKKAQVLGVLFDSISDAKATSSSFVTKPTKAPFVSLGTPFSSTGLSETFLTTERDKNFKVSIEESSKTVPIGKIGNYCDEEENKNSEMKSEGKEITGGSKKLGIEEENEDKIKLESSERNTGNEKMLADKEMPVVEEEEVKEKDKNERNEMISECEEVQKVTEGENKSGIGEDFGGKKTIFEEHEMRKEKTDERGEDCENDYQGSGYGETDKNVDEKIKDISKEKVEVEKDEEEEKDFSENEAETERTQSKEESHKEDKKSSEEEEKDSVSVEEWNTGNYSIEDLSTTETFLMSTFQEGVTKEIVLSNEYVKEGEVSTETTSFQETEIFEENSYDGESQTEPMAAFSITENDEESTPTQTGELVFRSTEYLETESAKITPTEHVIVTRETVQGHLSSEEYPTSTYYSADPATDVRRNSDFNAVLPPKYFQCRLIVQSILETYRCDGYEDCEDGTDEENCSCSQTLLRSKPGLICDGRVDCPDRSDEKNCSKCLESEFHCKKSNECISNFGRCDGITDCRFGEDETKCVALANGSALTLRPDGEPVLETEGILIYNKNGVWRVKCQEGTSAFTARDAIEVCSALGTIGYERFENRSLSPDNCTGFFVSCAENLLSSVDRYENQNGSYLWPWNAVVYSDGQPICPAALLQSQWLLTSSDCFKDFSLKRNFVLAAIGNYNMSAKVKEARENVIRVDGAHVISESNAALLHLSREVKISESVRPLGIPYTFSSDPKRDLCVAVGDQTVFLKILEDCPETFRCYKRVGSIPSGCRSKPWAGVVACQSRFGWYPASVFSEKSGYCDFEVATFPSLRDHLKPLYYALNAEVEIHPEPTCSGFRCFNGKCISQNKKCDGVPDCPFKEDESFALCKRKNRTKECKITELKCRNGRCIPKVLFGDGTNDCGDESDEPRNPTCVEYLRLTAPGRICDGRRNCYDKTDEDYKLCSCEDGKFQCRLSTYCVPKDFVCDGEKDCPGGEDEEECMGRQIVKNHSKTRLEVMQKSYGIWHTVCPRRMTKELSDALCRDFGFKEASIIHERNETVIAPKLDAFSWVKLNRKTSVALRGDKPFVRLVSLRRTCDFVRCS